MLKLNDKTFNRALQNNRKLLVMFSAGWAGPCNLVRPLFEELEQGHPDVRHGEFDVDDNPETPERYGVRALPTFLLFEDGVPKTVKAGALTPEALQSILVEPAKPEKKRKAKA